MTSDQAFYLAIKWLSRQMYSAERIRQKLQRHDVSSPQIDEVIERLNDQGLLRENDMAQALVDQWIARGKWGPVMMRFRLLQRGLDHGIVNAVMADHQEVDWLAIALHLRERYDISNPQAKGRFIRFLARQGFPSSVIAQAVDYELGNERVDDNNGFGDY